MSPCSISRSKGTLCFYYLKFLVMFLESILMSQMSIRKIVFNYFVQSHMLW